MENRIAVRLAESVETDKRMVSMNGRHRVLVLGGAHIDRRGRILGATVPGASNPGHFLIEPGGGCFNAARNLGLLGVPVRMISPRGGDSDGEAVAEAASACSVDDHPFIFLDRQTPSYTAILSHDGNLVVALADMDLYQAFSPRRLKVRSVREAFAGADLVLCDANLPEPTIAAIAAKARDLGKTLAAIAISPAKVIRLRGSLSLFDHIFMNESEVRALCGEMPDDPQVWPARLRSAGLRSGVITRGARPIIAFDEGGVFTLEPLPAERLVDVTGAGDALAAGTLLAMLEGMPLKEALRRGVALAAITLSSPHAVAPDLNRTRFETMVGLVAQARLLA